MKNFFKLSLALAGVLLALYAILMVVGLSILEVMARMPEIPAWVTVAILLVVVAAIAAAALTIAERMDK